VGPKAWRKQIEVLDTELTAHLRNRRLRNRDSQRLLNGVGAQRSRGHVLRFLCEEIEPTNNRGERDLRPAVIARKVSHCSKNERGARAFEAFISTLHTLRKLNRASAIPTLPSLSPFSLLPPEQHLLANQLRGWNYKLSVRQLEKCVAAITLFVLI